jgi:hypothetical protein
VPPSPFHPAAPAQRVACAPGFSALAHGPNPYAMTAAYNHQEMGVLDAAAPRPPPSSSTVADAVTWHTSSAFSCPTAPCGRQSCARSSLLPPSAACASQCTFNGF